ncbi:MULTISPECIES: hypothetical protein [Streptomyces]|uniref:DUF3592 domain-containing protein n=1 Tax=Streptomyces lycii TaxID=2654337 RepID=A0ABQ7F9Y0_9ACTN|nr:MULTISPECIES: hypothetical protein [Streptomyces]KAF4405355.1 hypothetical protein GCU69_30355 [Streptomyces lycii]
MSGDRGHIVPGSRTRYRVPLAVGIGCYVAVVVTVMYLVVDELGPGVLVLLWTGHGVFLIVLIRKLRIAVLSSVYTALFIVCASLMSVYVADMAREDLVLQQRGEKATVTVSKEWLDPAQGRKARHSHYELEHQDGSPVPGPEMETTSDLYDVGEVLTVMEDPDGELRPRTLGEVDATGELLGSGALALASLGAVGWMTWRGSDMAKRRDKRKPSAGVRVYKTVTRDHTTKEEQERKLREALEAGPADRRGYIKVHPEDYPDVSQHRAARIAWEMGLRAEAMGNKGSWRFGETVIEEVPHD